MKINTITVAGIFLSIVAAAVQAGPSSREMHHLTASRQSVGYSFASPGSSTPGRWIFDTRKFMPVSEVRPGMRGYALTVFKGTKIERFDIEILGVVSKFNMGKDYILFRALDGPSVTRGLNIAHGMSGSPIYVKGRLLGAISMEIPGVEGGASYAKEPIALATPIEEMFDAWSPNLPKNQQPISAIPDTSSANLQSEVSPSVVRRFSQIDIPVIVSGMSSRGVTQVDNLLSPYHFTVLAGGGAETDVSKDPLAQHATLEPGSSVGVALSQGDVDITAIGTVTYRDGNRLLLFGHPLADLGPIDAALTTSYVVDVYPSYQDSTKIGAPIKTVGRIFQDRPFSVGAVIGPLPHMIPVTVSVDDLSLKQHRTFHSQVIDHPLLASSLIDIVADQAISQVHGEPGDSMATVKIDVDADEIGHIVRTNTFFDSMSIDRVALGDLESVLNLLSSNPFYPLGVKGVTVSVTIRNRHDTAEIDHIFVKQSKFAPGDTIELSVALKPFKQPISIHTIKIKIPANTQPGSLDLNVKGGAAESGGGSISIGGFTFVRPSSEPASFATNISQLVKEFKERPRNNEIVAHLMLPTRAITVEGEKLSNLPPNWVGVMQSSLSSGLHTQRDEVKVEQPVRYIVSGSQSLSITIENKPLAGAGHGSTTPPPAPAAPSTPPSVAVAETSVPQASPAEAQPTASDAGNAEAGQVELSTPPEPSDTNRQLTSEPAKAKTNSQPAAAAPPPPPAPPALPAAPTAPAAPATPAATTDTTEPKPVGRVADVWRQSAATDFIAGTLTNASVSSRGSIILAPPLTKDAQTGANYVWCIVPALVSQPATVPLPQSASANGNQTQIPAEESTATTGAAGKNASSGVYLGTGDKGIVYKMDSAGRLTEFYKTGELEVTSLAVDNGGNVYAGTIPNGIVFRITPDGQGSRWFTAPEKYITALAYDSANQRLFIATGGGAAKVYAVSTLSGKPNSKPTALTWLDTSEADIESLAVDNTGVLFSGTSPSGLVYRTDLTGKSLVFYEASEANVSGLAVTAADDVYAATYPKATLVHIRPDGQSLTIYDRGTDAITAVHAVGDYIWATAGNTILRAEPDDSVETFVGPTDEQFISLGTSADQGAVYVGTSMGGSIYRLGVADKPRTGQIVSAIYDAGTRAQWGTLTWRAQTPADSQVSLQTRSGDITPPDSSWSDWSASYSSPTGQVVQSPSSRYLQYRAVLNGSQGDSLPRLESVAVYYLTRNEPPVVHVTSPKDGDAVSKSVTIQWTGSDPDQDTLSYDVSVSSDDGKTWTPIKKRWQPDATKPAAATPAPAAPPANAPPAAASDAETQREVNAMRADLNQHPELPAAVRAQILAQAPAVVKLTQPPPAPPATPNTDQGAKGLKDTSFDWDSTEVPDGTYIIQVVASDKVSDPGNPQTGKGISGAFTIANKGPVVTTNTPIVNADRTVSIHGIASSDSNIIKAVQFKVDTGDPASAVPDNGMFDSAKEPFEFTTDPLTPGDHKIETTVFDWAGNTAVTSTTVTVK